MMATKRLPRPRDPIAPATRPHSGIRAEASQED
jgi:hypothetical protein